MVLFGQAAASEAQDRTPPMEWKHANLKPVYDFLLDEFVAGRYRPAFPFP